GTLIMKKVLMSCAAGLVVFAASATGVSAEEYQVEEGDTLSQISHDYDVSVDNLKSWNDLDSDLIIVNQTLNIDNEDTSDNGNAEAEAAPTEDTQQETDNEAVEDEDNDNQATEQDVEEPANEEADQDNAVEQEEQNAQADQENTDDQEAVQEEESNEEEQEGNNEADGETKTMSATAYTADCEGCSGTTADGTDLDGDEKVIAVDPDEIPLGTEVHVEGYGDAVAGDTGGAINGDKIDLHMSDEDEANDFGNQEVEVTIK